MCRYLQVSCMKYLQIPTCCIVTILLYFCKNTCIYCASFCAGFRAGFCAVASPSARSHRRRIAVASPSHRRIALQPHRIAAASRRCTKRRRHADFIRITYASGAADSLYTDWKSGASTTAGSGRSDDEDICRSHGRKVVTRWSSKSYAMHRPMRSKDLKPAQHNPRKNLKHSDHDMQYNVQYLGNNVELKDPS